VAANFTSFLAARCVASGFVFVCLLWLVHKRCCVGYYSELAYIFAADVCMLTPESCKDWVNATLQ
jgi:hypothetical protein